MSKKLFPIPSITIVILTYNEALHIERCIFNAQRIAKDVVVVDSGSTDDTREIAARLRARVFQNAWVNHATQLNWALDHVDIGTEWVMRLDADEILDDELQEALIKAIHNADDCIGGFEVLRYMVFQEKMIRHGGGVSPGRVLRIWRRGNAICESRWMDEHLLLLTGSSRLLAGKLIDHNLNSLSWWVQKHNGYASREAVDLLNVRYRFLPEQSMIHGLQRTARIKRFIKNRVYGATPGGVRALMYFLYRSIFRLGILDGRGMAFHFMQGFWYRLLVDMKVAEVERRMHLDDSDVRDAIYTVLGIDLDHNHSELNTLTKDRNSL